MRKGTAGRGREGRGFGRRQPGRARRGGEAFTFVAASCGLGIWACPEGRVLPVVSALLPGARRQLKSGRGHGVWKSPMHSNNTLSGEQLARKRNSAKTHPRFSSTQEELEGISESAGPKSPHREQSQRCLRVKIGNRIPVY